MLPTQYAINSNELTTLFLENPDTFDVTRLNEIGRLIAYTTASVNPIIRPAWSLGSSFQMRIKPMIEITVFRIIPIIRHEGINVAAVEVMSKKTICAPP